MHKSRSFLIVCPMKIHFLILALFASICVSLNAQSGVVLAAGVSMAYTDNPATSAKGQFISGYHGSLTGRLGADNWYLRPGIELHKMKLLPKKILDPFSDDPSMYLLKFPAQIGVRLLKKDNFNVRIAGGLQFTYTVSVQKNSLDLDLNTITENQFGALIGAGMDLGVMTIDVNFEKGLTELYKGKGYKADYIFVTAGFLF